MNLFNLFLEYLFSGFLVVAVGVFSWAVVAEAFGYWDRKPKKP